jgi:hypothetical protein
VAQVYKQVIGVKTKLKSILSVATGTLLAVAFGPAPKPALSASKSYAAESNRRPSRAPREVFSQKCRTPASDYRDSFFNTAPEVLKVALLRSGCSDLLDRNSHSEQLLSDVIYKSVYDAAMKDPSGMMEFLATGVSDYYKDLVARAIVEGSVKNDPALAVSLVESVGDKTIQQVLRRKLVAALAETEPADALMQYKRLGDLSEAEHLQEIFAGLSQSSPTMAQAELKNLPNPTERMFAINGLFSGLARKEDPEEIMSSLGALKEPDHSMAMKAAVSWAAQSGRTDAVRDLLAGAGEGERLALICGAITAIPSERFGEVSAMAKELLSNDGYRSALPYLVSKVGTYGDFEVIGSEILTLPESEFKDRLLGTLATSVRKIWQDKALDWVNDQEAEGKMDPRSFGALLQSNEKPNELNWNP